MPIISRFLGVVIVIYYRDHNPPHFHAKYGDYEAAISIETGAILAGALPPRVLGLVQEWRYLNQSQLMENWRAAQARQPLKQIEPLE